MMKKRPWIVCLILAVIHLCITFVTDSHIFEFPSSDGKSATMACVDYILCKAMTFAVLYLFYYGIYVATSRKADKHDELVGILKTAAPYLLVIIVVLFIKLPGGYITNDEYAIYNNAITLTHDTWFNYLTTYYYIVSLMIVPFKYGPIIVKVVIQFFTVGYVIYRIRKYYGTRLGMWGYLLFVMYPIIAYTSSAHRLPIYFLVYLMMFTKLLFDGLENHPISLIEEIVLILTCAVLTQWRTEGIYLAGLIPILTLITYSNIRTKSGVIRFLLLFVVIQYVISIPQNGFTAKGLDDAANDRMKPFYAYTITNMYRNGLDLNKNAEDLAIIDRYLSLEVIEAINEHYEDINYEDVLILYQDGFVGVREEATVQDFIDYSDACKRIFINNPDVLIRTRWGAFCYAALPYKITYSGMSIRSLISLGISVVKSIAYNLFIPVAIVLLITLYSLVKRRWYTLLVCGGLIAHWFIVFVLAPASYFKYYFPVYIMAYFYVVIIGLFLYANKKKLNVKSPVR